MLSGWEIISLRANILSELSYDPAIFDEDEAKKFKNDFKIMLENSGRKVVNIALGVVTFL